LIKEQRKLAKEQHKYAAKNMGMMSLLRGVIDITKSINKSINNTTTMMGTDAESIETYFNSVLGLDDDDDDDDENIDIDCIEIDDFDIDDDYE